MVFNNKILCSTTQYCAKLYNTVFKYKVLCSILQYRVQLYSTVFNYTVLCLKPQYSVSSHCTVLIVTGMKMVNGKKSGKQTQIITPTANFRENAAFSCHMISTVRESRKNTGSEKKSAILAVPILPPTHNSFLLGFYRLATFKVINTGFEPINCCHIYPDSLVCCVMLIGKYKNRGNPRNRGDLSSLNYTAVIKSTIQ